VGTTSFLPDEEKKRMTVLASLEPGQERGKNIGDRLDEPTKTHWGEGKTGGPSSPY